MTEPQSRALLYLNVLRRRAEQHVPVLGGGGAERQSQRTLQPHSRAAAEGRKSLPAASGWLLSARCGSPAASCAAWSCSWRWRRGPASSSSLPTDTTAAASCCQRWLRPAFGELVWRCGRLRLLPLYGSLRRQENHCRELESGSKRHL